MSTILPLDLTRADPVDVCLLLGELRAMVVAGAHRSAVELLDGVLERTARSLEALPA